MLCGGGDTQAEWCYLLVSFRQTFRQDGIGPSLSVLTSVCVTLVILMVVTHN